MLNLSKTTSDRLVNVNEMELEKGIKLCSMWWLAVNDHLKYLSVIWLNSLQNLKNETYIYLRKLELVEHVHGRCVD